MTAFRAIAGQPKRSLNTNAKTTEGRVPTEGRGVAHMGLLEPKVDVESILSRLGTYRDGDTKRRGHIDGDTKRRGHIETGAYRDGNI